MTGTDTVAAVRERIVAMAARLEKVCYGHGTAGRVDTCLDCHEILQARRLLASLGVTLAYDDMAAQRKYPGGTRDGRSGDANLTAPRLAPCRPRA
jgi:hypothetical protein